MFPKRIANEWDYILRYYITALVFLGGCGVGWGGCILAFFVRGLDLLWEAFLIYFFLSGQTD